MAFDGAGNYVRIHNWQQDAANGLNISAPEMDGEDNSIQGAFNLTVTRDGQGKMTADFLPNVDNVLNLGSNLKRWASINGVPIPPSTSPWNFYPQTAAESAVGVTPTQFFYSPGTVLRYGVNTTPGTTDMTTPTQSAINVMNAAGGGLVFFPDGIYKITSNLTMPAGVYLASNGGPGQIQTVVTSPAVTLLWGGGASSMIKHGYTGTTGAGGGILGIALNGNGVATNGIDIKDVQKGTYERLQIQGTITQAIYMTNTAGQAPTGFCDFRDIHIQLRGGSTNSAHGITFDGVGTGVDGVTICNFRKVRIEHANGDGVHANLRADGMLFEDLFTFRANAETGFSVNAASTNPAAINGNWTFIRPILSSSVNVAQVGTCTGWTVLGADNVDVNSGYATFAFGPGSTDVNVLTSTSMRRQGAERTNGYRESIDHDPMFFARWDSTNNLLYTSRGAYLTGGTYASAVIGDASQPGGAVSLTTGNVSGNALYIAETPALGTTGLSVNYAPQMVVAWTPIQVANFAARVGYQADVTDPPNNGFYVEAAPATNANYRCVCRSGAVETAIVTTIAVAVAKIQWRIEADANSVRFLYRTVGNENWGVAGVISTNITASIVAPVAWIKTTNAAGQAMHIYDWKKGFTTEV